MANRCLGQCCTFIPLSISDEKLMFMAEQIPEGEILREMLVPVGDYTTHPITKYTTEEPRTLYRCKNLLPNGDCKIYEDRPDLCRNFPAYDRDAQCYRPDCQWSKVSIKRLPAPEAA